MAARLKTKYEKEIIPELRKTQGYKNPMQVPRLTKIVVNMGFKSTLDRDSIETLAQDLGRITGQKPLITKSRKSIANFKLREDMPIGAKVTLRGARMYEFLDRLVSAALPRIRDFRGVPRNAFDQHGNYTLGLTEQVIFPEIDPDKVKLTQGMDITMVTTAGNRVAAQELLRLLGLPFANA